jgi:hypothetical protein
MGLIMGGELEPLDEGVCPFEKQMDSLKTSFEKIFSGPDFQAALDAMLSLAESPESDQGICHIHHRSGTGCSRRLAGDIPTCHSDGRPDLHSRCRQLSHSVDIRHTY